MRKFLLAALLGTMMACTSSPYDSLSGQFPEIDQFPHEFKFSDENLPAVIETELIEGRVRPVGKVKINEQTEMLVSNNYQEGEGPWGDVTGYIFAEGKQKGEIVLASDFSMQFIRSVLDQDLQLTIYTSVMNEAGDEEATESHLDLRAQ